MNRRHFLFGSDGAALAAGITLPEFEHKLMIEYVRTVGGGRLIANHETAL